MTQAGQWEYMIKYLKSQGNNWKMGQLKKLKPDELKEEFDKCVEKIEKFIPMNSELEASKVMNLPSEISNRSIPQGSAPAKIVKWQILKTGKKGAYQIIREDHTDVVYVNFQGLLNDLTRDDLKELYRLMMLKYGDSRPEEEYERVLSWRYFHSCAVHCLTLEAAHIYMLTEVKYPLPSRVCQAMLEKRLIGDRKDEVCYQLLKLIERQAQQQ
ncbi:hypothetical protein Tco_0599760 [Tanacetum coccineum]